MGYGRPDPKRKWWLDLEDTDGEVQAPSARANRNAHPELEGE